MPLQKIIISSFSRLYLWKITETIPQLINLLDAEVSPEYLRYKTAVHQKQNLAKQLLFQYMRINDQIHYLQSGKPVLSGGRHISVSHSKDWVGVVLSNEPVGLDMEFARLQLIRTASKYIHPDEMQLFDNPSVESFQYAWTAKESIYKLAGQPALFFKRDIRLLHLETGNGTACLQQKRKISLFFNKIAPDLLICQAVFQQ